MNERRIRSEDANFGEVDEAGLPPHAFHRGREIEIEADMIVEYHTLAIGQLLGGNVQFV